MGWGGRWANSAGGIGIYLTQVSGERERAEHESSSLRAGRSESRPPGEY